VVALAWQDAELPSGQLSTWLRLFRRCGYVDDDCNERLTGELTIYRGVGGPEQKPGISWTLDLDKGIVRWGHRCRRSSASTAHAVTTCRGR
jgi:hypothetical protein